MAFSDFTLKEAVRRFALRFEESDGLFSDKPERPASPVLNSFLDAYSALARGSNTEKARSEFWIAPILGDVWLGLGRRFGLHSGVEFPAAPEVGLAGVCDFILTGSPVQHFLAAPVLIVVEAKKENIQAGLGQCVAAMVGATMYNERDGRASRTVYGAVTSGSIWQFLQVEGLTVTLDGREYYAEQVSKILGILSWMLTRDEQPEQLVA